VAGFQASTGGSQPDPCRPFAPAHPETLNRKHIVVGTDAAPEPGRHRRRFSADIFDMEIGNVLGCVHRAIDGIYIPFWNAGGNQRAKIAEPAILYFRPTILPSERVAAIVSR
jgi:hypothetical protein